MFAISSQPGSTSARQQKPKLANYESASTKATKTVKPITTPKMNKPTERETLKLPTRPKLLFGLEAPDPTMPSPCGKLIKNPISRENT